jgi:hypothetical protein
MCGAIHPLLQYVFMAWCLVKHRDNFTFIFNHYSLIFIDFIGRDVISMRMFYTVYNSTAQKLILHLLCVGILNQGNC